MTERTDLLADYHNCLCFLVNPVGEFLEDRAEIERLEAAFNDASAKMGSLTERFRALLRDAETTGPNRECQTAMVQAALQREVKAWLASGSPAGAVLTALKRQVAKMEAAE